MAWEEHLLVPHTGTFLVRIEVLVFGKTFETVEFACSAVALGV